MVLPLFALQAFSFISFDAREQKYTIYDKESRVSIAILSSYSQCDRQTV
jgi:hypothetical protein